MADQDPTHGPEPSRDAAPPTRVPPTDPIPSLDSLRTRFEPEALADSIATRAPADTYATSDPDSSPSADRQALPDAFPGYEVLETLGEGGMGLVYKARQIGLNRLVALKVVLGGHRAGPKELIRFLAEAEAVASVRHPHVVQVHEYGEVDNRPFLAMEYLPGGSLADRLKHQGRLKPHDAAELIANLARAVQAAHDQGIVHRDLKPANVLFDAHSEPKVTDFGLAKRATGSDQTRTQAVMGTPAYMSPEQAQGKSKFVGPQADVYALGVILYECLTGSRPFDHEDTLVLLARVVGDDPAPPSKHITDLPRDLELIALKCLSKDPADRYPTAAALAEDLAHFVAGEPVTVRPAGTIERALKWARRKPTLATAYALTAAVVVLLAFGASLAVLWWNAEQARGTAEVAKQNAETARVGEEKARKTAEAANESEKTARTVAEQAREAEKKARSDVEIAREKLTRAEYGRTIQVAYQEWRDNNSATTRALLEGTRADLRGWEWKYVQSLGHRELLEFKGHTRIVMGVSWSPDGSRIATASGDGTARVWDARSGAEILTLKGHVDSVVSVSWSPDGSRIATASHDGSAGVWDVRTGAETLTLNHRILQRAGAETFTLQHRKRLYAVSWSPDGSRIATASQVGTAQIWDARTGLEELTLRGHTGPVLSVSWSPDGSRVITGGEDGTARVWDARIGARCSRSRVTPDPCPRCLGARTARASPPRAGTGERGCGTRGPAPGCSGSLDTPTS